MRGWRISGALAGMAVVATAAHKNIMFVGGYGTGDAWQLIALAMFAAVGSGFAMLMWHRASKVGALALVLPILASEVYWVQINADRELTARLIREAPVVKARAKRAELVRQVAEAEKAKKAADDAALSQAALPGCKTVCAKMHADAKAEAAATLTAKQSALDALPDEEITGALAGYLGIPQWAWDLSAAAFRSLGVLGGSLIIAFAMHPRSKPTSPAGEVEPVKAPIAAVSEPAPIVATPRELDARPVIALLNARVPVARGKRASWAEIFLDYHRHKSPEDPAYTEKEFGRIMRAICDHEKTPIVVEGNQVYCIGRKLIDQSPKVLGHMTKRVTT